MADDPPTFRRMLLAFGVFAVLLGAPAAAYWFEQWDEVRHTVRGTTVVTGCPEGRCVGRFTSADGVVVLEPVPVPGAAAEGGAVPMWLSPRERHPAPDPPRLWPATAVALAVVLGVQVLLAVLWLVHLRVQARTGRPWRPTGWRSVVLNQVFLLIVLGGLLAWCSGGGAIGTATGWEPGHVVGVAGRGSALRPLVARRHPPRPPPARAGHVRVVRCCRRAPRCSVPCCLARAAVALGGAAVHGGPTG